MGMENFGGTKFWDPALCSLRGTQAVIERTIKGIPSEAIKPISSAGWYGIAEAMP